MASDWAGQLRRQRVECERTLRDLLRQERSIPPRLRAAMAHSLFGGGKRLRPIIAVWTCDALAVPRTGRDECHAIALRAGAALEMVHTYSLIHDDLPAMDDDVLRRGRPTCHVAFDEGTAILAGDGLQALAFATLARCPRIGARLVEVVAVAAGPAGMVGGQQDDLDAEGQPVTAALVRRIHVRKTAALIAASFVAGGIAGGAGDETLTKLAAAGRDLGLAFQGADDLLDLTATTAQLGKSAGKDAAAGKATWIRVEGIEAAAARTRRLGRRGAAALGAAVGDGPDAARLGELAQKMWQRDR